MRKLQDRTVPARPMRITWSKAVSRGYCVGEYDRNRARSGAMSEDQKKHDIHFTGVAYDSRYPVVWCGFTSFVGDLLWTFDPKTKRFESKDFTALREKEEVKIHRGLQVGPDGQLYFGTASLVNVKERHYAPGGRLFRYSPTKNEYEFLGRPIANDYIQTIDVDYSRGLLYGATYPVGRFFGWDLDQRRLVFQAYVADWPHQVCVDDEGQCWATYNASPGSNKPRLLKYSSKTSGLTWTELGLLDEGAGIDSFVNGGDGFLYIGTSAGALVRLDPRKPRLEFVLKPTTSMGFGALTKPADGRIYGIAGGGTTTQVFSYDLNSNDVVLYGPAYDSKRRTSIYRPHELAVGPKGCLYCPETDNPERQCYLWEIRLPA